MHSQFDSKEELIQEIENHIQKLKNEDFSKVEDLITLFAPTGEFQEISIDSGWSKLYLILSERFDNAIKELIEEFNLNPFSNI